MQASLQRRLLRERTEDSREEDDSFSTLYGNPDLTVFSGLEELTLLGLYNELPWWRSQIVQVLKRSPRLRMLALSLSVKTVDRYVLNNENGMFRDFFDQLCDDYGETGAAPLRLRSLRFNMAMFPSKVDSVKRLTDLSFLEKVHIENVDIWVDGFYINVYNDDSRDNRLLFDIFGPAHCPNLRRINTASLDCHFYNYLAGIADASFARKLAVSSQTTWSGYELAALLRPDPRYPSLPLHLRMLDIDLVRVDASVIGQDGNALRGEDMPSARQVLEHLVSRDDGTLEGLTVHLREDPGAEVGFEGVDSLVHALPKLTNLTQLAVIPDAYTKGPLTKGSAERLVAMLANAVPRLRYIRVHESYWRLWRDGSGAIKLESLVRSEAIRVELFRESIWEPLSFYTCPP